MVQILAIKPGRLKAVERKALAAVDIIVIELDDPTELRVIHVEGAEVAASEMTWAALEAIEFTGLPDTSARFVKNLRAIVTRNLQRRSASNTEEKQ
jgi:hypothetical protein